MTNLAGAVIDPTLNLLVRALSLGQHGMEVNPDFLEHMEEIAEEPRNLATQIYDKGTLVIVDDTEHRLIPRYRFTP